MQLAPMRPRVILPKYRIDVGQIAPIIYSWGSGDRDGDAGSLVIWAQHARVAGDEAIFHGKNAIDVLGEHQLTDSPQRLFAVFDRDGVLEFVKVRNIFDWVDFRTIGYALESLLVGVRRILRDVHHLHLADVALTLDRRHRGDIGQAIEMAGLSDRAPKEAEVPIVLRQLIVLFHAGF